VSSPTPFEIVLAHLDGFVEVKLRGDLDFNATVDHAEALREIIDLRSRVVLDMAELESVDSSGVSFLVRLSATHDGPVRLTNVSPRLRRRFAILGLESTFDIGD
jgi:anti-anti-sigma factor